MKHAGILIVLVVASPLFVFAQESTPPQRTIAIQNKRDEKQSQDDLKRARAVSLVEQTANEAPLWDDREAAVSALTEAADLLWGESPQARVWLTKAWDLVDKVEERENSEKLRQIWRGSRRSRLRAKVLNVAQHRDPQLAEGFLKKLEESQKTDDSERGAFDDRSARSEQLLQLALEAIETNPELAESLAERSLQDGLSFNLQTVLLRLRQKGISFANRLFDAALVRLMNSTPAFSEDQVLASYLFRPGQVLAQLPDGAVTVAVVQTQLPVIVVQGQLPEQTPAQMDPVRARRFLTVVYRTLLAVRLPTEDKSQAAGEFVLLANSLAQPFQTYAPDLWQSIAVRAAQFAAVLPTPTAKPHSGMTDKVREALKNGASAEETRRLRVEALEQEAERESDPLARRIKFAEAALATAPMDFEHGKLLAGKIADDDQLRLQITTFLYYRAALTFLAENHLAEAEATALKIAPSIERALTLIAVAQQLVALKLPGAEGREQAEARNQRAVELLVEADRSLKPEDASTNIAKVRLGKIAISHLLDISNALTDFEQAIAIINRLEKFDPTDASAPGLGIEGFGATEFTVPRVGFGFGFGNALDPLVKEDFEHTATTVERLVSPSVRGNCRLEVARKVLEAMPKFELRTARRGSALR